MSSLYKLNITHSADWHLNHPKVSTDAVCDRMVQYMFPYIEKSDILFVSGDMFESLIDMNNKVVDTCIEFFSALYKLAEKHNIVLRFLKGTGIHDRNQIGTWVKFHEETGYTNDTKYFNRVDIEYIEKLDLRVVYIPEDVPYKSSSNLLEAIKQMFHKAGWDKADIIVGHGYFDHTLPPMKKLPKIVFNEKQISEILHKDGKVLMGHIHTPSKLRNILYAGSFERLRHNEEEVKGFFFIEKNNPKFIINESATKMLSKDLSKYGDDKETLVSVYKSWLNKNFTGKELAYVRVIHPDIHIRQILGKITAEYSNIKYTHMSSEKDKDNKATGVSFEKDTGIVVTEENLPDLIVQNLEKYKLGTMDRDKVQSLLENI